MLVDVGEVNGRRFVNNSSVGPILSSSWNAAATTARWLSEAIAAARSCAITGNCWWKSWATARPGRSKPFVFVGNNEYQLDGFDLGARPRLDAASCTSVWHPISEGCVSGDGSRGICWPTRFGRSVESLRCRACAIRSASRRLWCRLTVKSRSRPTSKYRIRRRALVWSCPLSDRGRSAVKKAGPLQCRTVMLCTTKPGQRVRPPIPRRNGPYAERDEPTIRAQTCEELDVGSAEWEACRDELIDDCSCTGLGTAEDYCCRGGASPPVDRRKAPIFSSHATLALFQTAMEEQLNGARAGVRAARPQVCRCSYQRLRARVRGKAAVHPASPARGFSSFAAG